MGEDETIEELKSLVRRASAIVVQPELDFGRLWEAVLVSTPVDLSRLLLLVPNPAVRPLRYVRIRDLVRERLGVEAPAQERCPPCDAFLFEGGKPVPIVLDPPGSWACRSPNGSGGGCRFARRTGWTGSAWSRRRFWSQTRT